MAQISLYVPDDVLDDLRREAGERRTSISKLVLSAVVGRKDAHGWPEGYFELYGSCPEFPSVEEIRMGLDGSLDDEFSGPGET